MSNLDFFIPLTKIDQRTGEVWGVAAIEEIDRVGEVFDYESSKPNIESWSDELYKLSGGKSYGNIRSMHGTCSAGILIEKPIFDDANKRVLIKAKINDDNELKKLYDGNYTGFSIGGSYGKRWFDPAIGKQRYTAIVREITLGDIACSPNAKIELIKIDGSSEIMDLEKISKRKDVSPAEKKSTVKEYGEVNYADEANKKYPLDTAMHVKAAARYFGMPKNRIKYSTEDKKKIDSKISAAKKKFGIEIQKTEENIDLINAIAKNDLNKILSFGDIGDAVRNAIRNMVDGIFCNEYTYFYIVDLYQDKAIIELDSKLYSIEYTINDIGDVEIGNIDLVQKEYTIVKINESEADMNPEELQKIVSEVVSNELKKIEDSRNQIARDLEIKVAKEAEESEKAELKKTIENLVLQLATVNETLSKIEKTPVDSKIVTGVDPIIPPSTLNKTDEILKKIETCNDMHLEKTLREELAVEQLKSQMA